MSKRKIDFPSSPLETRGLPLAYVNKIESGRLYWSDLLDRIFTHRSKWKMLSWIMINRENGIIDELLNMQRIARL